MVGIEGCADQPKDKRAERYFCPKTETQQSLLSSNLILNNRLV